MHDFLLEVGGELVARGHHAGGAPWRVGIERPNPGAPGDGGYEAVALLADRAMATSGDYRQMRLEGADRVHHILDPRLGQSAVSDVASVTVLARDCATADALATTVTVMGIDDGVPMAQAFAPGVEVLWIQRELGGAFTTGHTPGFPLGEASP